MTVHNEVYGLPADGSDSGLNIALTGGSLSAALLLHTGPTDPLLFDEIWVYGTNLNAAIYMMSIMWGGLAAKDEVPANIPVKGSGPWCIIPGWRLYGNPVPKTVWGFVEAAAAAAGGMSCNISIVNRTTKVTT